MWTVVKQEVAPSEVKQGYRHRHQALLHKTCRGHSSSITPITLAVSAFRIHRLPIGLHPSSHSGVHANRAA